MKGARWEGGRCGGCDETGAGGMQRERQVEREGRSGRRAARGDQATTLAWWAALSKPTAAEGALGTSSNGPASAVSSLRV